MPELHKVFSKYMESGFSIVFPVLVLVGVDDDGIYVNPLVDQRHYELLQNESWYIRNVELQMICDQVYVKSRKH